MRSFLGEYGTIIVAVVVVLSSLFVFSYLLNDDKGVVVTYNNNMIYSNDFFKTADLEEDEDAFDRVNGINNIVEIVNEPHFKLGSQTTVEDLVLQVPDGLSDSHTSTYTFAEVADLFDMNDKLQITCHSDGVYKDYQLEDLVTQNVGTFEMVITKYTPEHANTNGGSLNGAVVTDKVDALDKYGNLIVDSNGYSIAVDEVKYLEEVYTKDNIDEFFINWDVSCRFKIVYRFQYGTLKSEYTTMYVNDIRKADDVFQEVLENWKISN